jgi:RNA polymerase sigma factor (sigma-70 family)
MAEFSPVDDLYRRYAASGDLTALAGVFDALAPDLLRLARRLASDRSQAEDLVQETFLTALEQSSSYDPERAVTPWLIGILVNRARGERRRARRELDTEELDRGEEPEPIERVAAGESCSLVEKAIAELPPRLRAVVEGKVLHGRGSIDLAAELDLTHGALRARLSRGLRRLRRALPAGLATGLAFWFTHSRGLAQVRVRVLEESARLPVGAAGMGGVLMSKKAVLLSLIVAIAGLGGGLWGAGLFDGEQKITPGDSGLAPPEEVRDEVAILSETTGPAPREELASEVPGGEAGLVVRVTEASAGSPIEGLNVRLSFSLDGEADERAVATDDEGEARFEFDETVKLRVVHVDAGEMTTPVRGWLNRALSPGERQELELLASEGGSLSGRVLDHEGIPVPNATVLGWHRYWDEPARRTRSRLDGTFTLDRLGENFYVTAHTSRLACQWGVRGDLAPGSHAEGLVIELAPTESLHGVVLTPDRTRLEGVELRVDHDLGSSGAWLMTDVAGILRFHAGESEAVSDSAGRFSLKGLPRGRHYVKAERAPYLVYREYHEIGEQPAEIVLDEGLRLTGRIFDAKGRPAEGARVRFWPYYGNLHTVKNSVLCDDTGRFTLSSLVREGKHAIAVVHEGHALEIVQPVLPGPDGGEHVELRLDPEQVITGRVVDVDGNPVTGAEVWIEGEREVDLGYTSGRRHTWEHVTDLDSWRTEEDGSFHFGNLYRGSFTVHLHPPGERFLGLEAEVRAPTQDLELVLDEQAMRKVVLTGRVTDAVTGEAIEHFAITPMGAGDWGFVRELHDPDGRYEIVGLEPEEISIRAKAEGYAPSDRARQRYDVGEHRVDFALLPVRTLILSITDSSGAPHDQGRVEVVGADGRPRSMKAGPGQRSTTGWIEKGHAALHELPAEPLTVRLTVEKTVHEVDVDLTFPLEGELEVVFDVASPTKAARGTVEVIAFVVTNDVDEKELQRHLAGTGEEKVHGWFTERLESGAIAFAETSIDVEIQDERGVRCAEYHLTPLVEGGFHCEQRVWFGTSEEKGSSDPPVPAFHISLPVGPYTLRARIEGHPAIELPLEIRADERLRQSLVVRRR